VTDSEEDRAAMLEQAGEAATMGARTDLALPLLEQAHEIRERLGDDSAVARVIGLRARALTDGRQFEAAIALLRPALERFPAPSDDPAVITLASIMSRNLSRLGQTEEGLALVDQVLAAAERIGAADIAAEAMTWKGLAYGLQGRMWEARALYAGARQLAEEINRHDLMAMATSNLSFEVALDDPRLAVELQREDLDRARRMGRRTSEITSLGNVAEDARRTGDWDWVLGEIDAVLTLQPEGNDVIPLRLARQILLTHRGTQDDAESAALELALREISDNDVRIGYLDIRSSTDFVAGRWAEAAATWLEVSGISELNQPYVLPRAGHAFVLAGDDAGAEGTLDRLRTLGTRGRAADADRAAISAGIAALRGDASGALSGYRTAMSAWRALSLPWDEALTTLEAVTVLGTSDPEVSGWVDGARATFQRLQAAPMMDRLDEAAAAAPPRRAPTETTVESRV
jgi:tetratricopeptide (TPR) repeat protein